MSYVYFFRNEHDGYIKMGHTKRSVMTRFEEWKRIIPHKLIFLGYQEGSRSLEKYLKDLLFYPYMIQTETKRGGSEWFEPAPRILRYIEEQCVTTMPTSTGKTA